MCVAAGSGGVWSNRCALHRFSIEQNGVNVRMINKYEQRFDISKADLRNVFCYAVHLNRGGKARISTRHIRIYLLWYFETVSNIARTANPKDYMTAITHRFLLGKFMS